MKLLAISTDSEDVSWENTVALLKEEARHVYTLYLSDILREIYFTETGNAVLILECSDKSHAQALLDAFPLVKSGMIRFDLMELRPYDGLKRLME